MAKEDFEELKKRIRGAGPIPTPTKKEVKPVPTVTEREGSVSELIEKLAEKASKEKPTPERLERVKLKAGVSDLGGEHGAFIGLLSGMYSRIGVLGRLTDSFLASNFGKQLSRNLTAAGITYSPKQYIGLILAYSFFSLFILVPYLFLVCLALNFPLSIAFVGGIFASILSFVMGIVYPGMRANGRSKTIEKELAFGLRHLATQVRAGIGLNTAMASVAQGGYGLLSEEFQQALDDIDKGTPTPDALTAMRLRNRSKGLRRALTQVIRALRTGGSLSDLLIMIADDVSYEVRMRMKDFGERLNLVGVLFMFVCVVFPVMVSILISVYPLLGEVPEDMMLLVRGYFFLLAPVMSLFIVYLIRMMDPT